MSSCDFSAEAAAKALAQATVTATTMSSVEVERQPELEKFHAPLQQNPKKLQMCCRCALQEESRWPQTAEEIEALKQQLLEERDEAWRLHERAQITYLQNQNAQLLVGLHVEIERLQNGHRDLQRRMLVEGKCATEDEKTADLEKANARIRELTEALEKKDQMIVAIQQNSMNGMDRYKEKTKQQEDRIRQLTCELHEKTLTVTQLSTQLRQFRLREAMAQAQQRRRASCESPSRTSPTAAFRLFAPPPRPKDQVQQVTVVSNGDSSPVKATASVTVTYPQPPQRPQFISATRGATRNSAPESTEKPMRRTASLTGRSLAPQIRTNPRTAASSTPATSQNPAMTRSAHVVRSPRENS
ncbi:hypothetical protein L596_018402 [Steinernema carpocapsae]|uniref:CCDC92/74 N-terminal domain-containing protein n=1 Tax=Steinernema carpocapsae TaxID=34508 RepID=A0A4V6A211_STECR|nr:hypothetical protein L596_018402 [Steinernema carpocapsae]